MSDEDRQPDGSIKSNAKSARDKLAELASARDAQVTWPGNLEACFGLSATKARPSWQAEQIDSLDDGMLATRHPSFVAAARQVHEWITSPPAPPVAEEAPPF